MDEWQGGFPPSSVPAVPMHQIHQTTSRKHSLLIWFQREVYKFPCSLCHLSGSFPGMNKTSRRCHKCKCPAWVSARNGNIMHHHFDDVRTLNICLVGAPFQPNLLQMISVMWNLFRPFPFVLREQFAINIHSQSRSYWYKNVSNVSSHSER